MAQQRPQRNGDKKGEPPAWNRKLWTGSANVEVAVFEREVQSDGGDFNGLPHALKGVLGTLAIIGLFTALEMRLLQAVHSRPGPNVGHFVGINVFMSLWILTVLGLVRSCGFSLSTASRQQTV